MSNNNDNIRPRARYKSIDDDNKSGNDNNVELDMQWIQATTYDELKQYIETEAVRCFLKPAQSCTIQKINQLRKQLDLYRQCQTDVFKRYEALHVDMYYERILQEKTSKINQEDEHSNNTSVKIEPEVITDKLLVYALQKEHWENILIFFNHIDLISLLKTSKGFNFIHESELLSQKWLKHFVLNQNSFLLSELSNTIQIMSIFYQTEIFRAFSRIITYKIDNLQKQSMSINLHHKKHYQLFKYNPNLSNIEQQLFRQCQFKNNDNNNFTHNNNKLKEGELTIVTKNKFIQNLNTLFHFNKWKDYINWSIYNIAGGCLLKCILSHPFESYNKQDIDLFYSFTNNQQRLSKSNKMYVIAFTETMIANGYNVIVDYDNCTMYNKHVYNVYVQFDTPSNQKGKLKRIESGWKLYLTKTEVEEREFLLNEANGEKYTKFQFISNTEITVEVECMNDYFKYNKEDILVESVNHDQIICNFDIDVCQIRFNGNNLFCTFAFIFAVSSMTCISYKLALREHFVDNIDWSGFHRAIKYNYRGLKLLVPITFDLDPLDSVMYQKWYNKHRNTYNPDIGYRSLRNHDHMNVFYELKMIITNQYDDINNSDDEENISNIMEMKEDIMKYGILSNQLNDRIYNLMRNNNDNIDPINILIITNHFYWLYKIIKISDITTQFSTLQQYIHRNNFQNTRWNTLMIMSILFIQCLYYPSIIKNKFMKNIKLFKRFMIIFHWMFDYWFHAKNFKPSNQVILLPELTYFIFFRLTKIQALYCYSFNSQHLIIYLKNKKYFKRYILDVLMFEMKYNQNSEKNKYKISKKNIANLRIFSTPYVAMKPSFRILAIKCLCTYFKEENCPQIIELEKFKSLYDEFKIGSRLQLYVPSCSRITKEQHIRLRAMHDKYINMNRRMKHNHNLSYKNVHCHNKKCNVNYYVYLYGMDYNMLYDVHPQVKFDKDLRIKNKWYKCGQCECVYYCCRKCQKRDWIHHRSVCFQV